MRARKVAFGKLLTQLRIHTDANKTYFMIIENRYIVPGKQDFQNLCGGLATFTNSELNLEVLPNKGIFNDL